MISSRGREDDTMTGVMLLQKDKEPATHGVRGVLCGHEDG